MTYKSNINDERKTCGVYTILTMYKSFFVFVRSYYSVTMSVNG